MNKRKQLWDLCQKFINDQRISCAESIYQCDWVSENSPEFIEQVCEIIGYYEYRDE
jgi:hypothetical protein